MYMSPMPYGIVETKPFNLSRLHYTLQDLQIQLLSAGDLISKSIASQKYNMTRFMTPEAARRIAKARPGVCLLELNHVK